MSGSDSVDSVCPASHYTSTNYGTDANIILRGTDPTLVTTDNRLARIPAYPTGITYPVTFTNPQNPDTPITYTANIFSIGNIVTGSLPDRYRTESAEYLVAGQELTTSELQTIYSYFTTTDIPGQTPARKMILPTLAPNLTGNQYKISETGQKESVSYDLLYSLKFEFCYYIKYYSVVLKDLARVQGKASTGPSGAFPDTTKNDLLRNIVNTLAALKTRLADITRIAAYIGQKQTSEMSGLSTSINQFVKDTRDTVGVLNENAKLLSSKDKESHLRSRQVEFSEEKNAYANQLLGLYGFANLIALGLLFYIYKS